MRTGSRLSDLRYKIATIELLNLAKNYFTYRDLSKLIGLPETVLSRYVKGHVLPTIDRAKTINEIIQMNLRLEADVQRRIQLDDQGLFDNTKLISDMLLLERAVQNCVNAFAGRLLTKVLTPAVDGIPLATLIASRLGVPLIIAKKSKEVGVRDFIEETYIANEGSPTVRSLYVPKDTIKRNDSVLIVDDVIDTGDTQMALIRIVQRARAEVGGIYALVGIGKEWEARLQQACRAPIEVVLRIDRRLPHEEGVHKTLAEATTG